MADGKAILRGSWDEPVNDLKYLGGVIERDKENLAEALTASTQVPVKFANLDVEYGVYILTNFGKYLNFLKEEGLHLEDRIGIGKIAALEPFNMPGWGTANSLAHAIIFPQNSITINLPSKSHNFNRDLIYLLGMEAPEFLTNMDGSPIFSDKSGKDFMLDKSEEADVVQIYGHPQYFSPEVKKRAWSHNTILILEGPGNNPGVICKDADIETAAKTLADERTMNSGQVCMGLEVLFIHEDVYDPSLDLLKKELDNKVVGPAEDHKTDVGPIGKGIAGMAEYNLNEAIKHGAKIIYETPDFGVTEGLNKTGKVEFPNSKSKNGFKQVPIILVEDATPDMMLMQEEKFCPILPIMKFNSDEEVIALINKNRNYYLATTIYGDEENHKELYKFGKESFGNLFWNRNIFGFDNGTHYDVLKDGSGGYKHSRYKLVPIKSRPMYNSDKPDNYNFKIEDGRTHWVYHDFSKKDFTRPKRF